MSDAAERRKNRVFTCRYNKKNKRVKFVELGNMTKYKFVNTLRVRLNLEELDSAIIAQMIVEENDEQKDPNQDELNEEEMAEEEGFRGEGLPEDLR